MYPDSGGCNLGVTAGVRCKGEVQAALLLMLCPVVCRRLQKRCGSSPELLNCIHLFFPVVAARHFERSTIRSRSFKKINKAFSVLRRTKSGSAVSNQADRERETVGNSAAGEEGNALFSLCYHLKWDRGRYPCGNWMSTSFMYVVGCV